MRFVVLGLALLTVGCTSVLGPPEERQVGVVLGLAGGTPAIEAPTTVRAGEDFTVTIRTGWPNGCAREDGTEVEVRGASATITPYDRMTEGSICTMEVQAFVHTATLRFAQPGTARLLIRGRATRTGGARTIERSVTVR
ncbi:MAG TPA: hypothetical protein VE913_16520 [Longimicrobium sp.]|nr:hypothetical protein [Longimicrobium sp.]